jgi:hypothetical protein
MTDIKNLKAKALHADEPLRTLILSLPDEIEKSDLVSKMDVILKIIDAKKEN